MIRIRSNLIKSNILRQKRTFISSPTELISTLSTSLSSFHEFSGIPWWALIPITTVTLRSIWTLPLAILQRKRTQKQAELRPIINSMGPILRLKLASRAQEAKSKENKNLPMGKAASLTYEQIMLLSIKERRERQKRIFKENGCEMYKNFILPVFQIPLWILMSATFRDLSGWNEITTNPLDSSLLYEGLFWFQDLTVLDQYSVLPIVLGTLALSNIEWNFKTFKMRDFNVKRSNRITAFDSLINISRLSVVFLMTISTQAPTALVLYWISSNGFSVIQNILLDYYIPIKYTPETRSLPKEASKDSTPLFTRVE